MLSQNQHAIPLFYATFDYQHYQESGEIDSCKLVANPLIRDDQYIKESLEGLISYIKNKYNSNGKE
jgi:hypothetical protein